MKGSEAVGSSVRVSFSAPPHCSTSQVSQGICGDPVSYYIVEWDTSDAFNSAALSSLVVSGQDLLLQEQRVTTMASSAMSGTFQLAFNGETTTVINAAASAEDVRYALENLSGIATAAVSRDYAVAVVGGASGGAELDLTFGSQDVQCTSGSATVAAPSCDASFSACQLVRLEGVWYRVKASFEADNSGQVRRGVFMLHTFRRAARFCVFDVDNFSPSVRTAPIAHSKIALFQLFLVSFYETHV